SIYNLTCVRCNNPEKLGGSRHRDDVSSYMGWSLNQGQINHGIVKFYLTPVRNVGAYFRKYIYFRSPACWRNAFESCITIRLKRFGQRKITTSNSYLSGRNPRSVM